MRHPDIAKILATYNRVVITGGPRCGKSTLASMVSDRKVLFCEDFRPFGVKAAPDAMLAAVTGTSRYLLESVHVARALRKGLEVDAVIYLHRPRIERTQRQIAMAKAVHTVFKEWRASNPSVPVFVLD